MPLPCRKCGATKTEPVRRGTISYLLGILGYRLRACSRCRRLRVLREGVFKPRGVYARNAAGAAPPSYETVNGFDPDGFTGCPRCGGMEYDREPRKWLERGLHWAPMARCRLCRKRFTYPLH